MATRARTVEHGAPTSTGLSNVKLGMWAFLGSECLLFGALISTFILFRNRPVTGLFTPCSHSAPRRALVWTCRVNAGIWLRSCSGFCCGLASCAAPIVAMPCRAPP